MEFAEKMITFYSTCHSKAPLEKKGPSTLEGLSTCWGNKSRFPIKGVRDAATDESISAIPVLRYLGYGDCAYAGYM
jgi:hypothetical protein